MSGILKRPCSTRFDMGQETKSASGSISVTRTLFLLNKRRYLAAVAPPNPPPTTITCGADRPEARLAAGNASMLNAPTPRRNDSRFMVFPEQAAHTKAQWHGRTSGYNPWRFEIRKESGRERGLCEREDRG